ncbi:hypothetical protein EW026_g2664 [Hermanssonia centrifuga]|uniref:Uncharacterized protein n=1 Tax=Hermanssonia centrifuga TaxID=98765 RepID=A0A4S4KNK3_9APHY|nr:hypothetical protein EW026_g2664 [Hermanssonia centrifuga]
MEPISKELPPLPPSPATADTPPQQHGLIKRLTTKFRSSTATGGPPAPGSPPESHPELVSGKPKRKPTLRMPSLSGPITNKGNQKSNLENSFTSPEQRQAALRARGLLPSQAQPLRDAHGYKLPLSEQEQQLDRQQAVQVPRTSEEPESEAGKIAEAWMKRNNISSQECSPSSPSKSNDTRPSHAKGEFNIRVLFIVC